eukprot:TRINITY_DN11978_c0_g1_i1.p1 TRINITY_DN11978_c0_g1~~TRINITY_DN11978_c0_g1_i1.p1  ORF type:complete len:515 (-),score=51.10 TRINITY_DN11978_c0_g1_i1:317-1861(-)
MSSDKHPILFSGKIVIVEQHSKVLAALELLRGEPVLGLDMEWKPELGHMTNNPIALLQLATDRVCVLFQLLRLGGMPSALKDVLVSTEVTKAVCGWDAKDSQKMRDHHSITCAGVVDICDIAYNSGYSRLGLKNLAFSLWGTELDKSLAVSDWEQPLSSEQIAYAATDAWVTRRIFMELNEHPRFKCSLCDRVFSLKRSLEQHVISRHAELVKSGQTQPLQCFFCDSMFLCMDEANRHCELLHRDRVCVACELNFRSSELAFQHHRDVHDWQRSPVTSRRGSFICASPPKLSFSPPQHRGTRTYTANSECPQDDHAVSYSCDVCRQRFRSPQGCGAHMRSVHHATVQTQRQFTSANQQQHNVLSIPSTSPVTTLSDDDAVLSCADTLSAARSESISDDTTPRSARSTTVSEEDTSHGSPTQRTRESEEKQLESCVLESLYDRSGLSLAAQAAEEQRMQCMQCSREFHNVVARRQHEMAKSDPHCWCGRSFNTLHALYQHVTDTNHHAPAGGISS